FADEWREIWVDIVRSDGGKLSATTAGAILGTVLGGVGIATGGAAIGLPLALVLGLGGLLSGAEIDSLRGAAQRMVLIIPEELRERVQLAAAVAQISPEELIVQTLVTAFPPTDELA